jgi:methionyl-tRNA formyltransferase
MGNNWAGWQIIRYLRDQKEDIVGLVVHPEHKQRYGKEIVEVSQIDSTRVFDGSRLKQEKTLEAIRSLQLDIGISVLFDYKLSKEFIDLFPKGIVNLHPSYLPFNRGQYPNVWSIVEETPAGVSLHYIDEGIDTGDIIAQRKVRVLWKDTGMSLYGKLERKAVELFKEYWQTIRQGKQQRIPQTQAKGTYHTTKDVEKIDKIDLDRKYYAKDLINILRARTFPPYEGAYFFDGDEKIYMRLQLLDEDEIGD